MLLQWFFQIAIANIFSILVCTDYSDYNDSKKLSHVVSFRIIMYVWKLTKFRKKDEKRNRIYWRLEKGDPVYIENFWVIRWANLLWCLCIWREEGGPAGGVNIIISCSSMPKTFGGKFHIKQNAVCSAMGPDQISTY